MGGFREIRLQKSVAHLKDLRFRRELWLHAAAPRRNDHAN